MVDMLFDTRGKLVPACRAHVDISILHAFLVESDPMESLQPIAPSEVCILSRCVALHSPVQIMIQNGGNKVQLDVRLKT